MKTLIIAEKPAAAQKIAYALGKPQIKRQGKIRYYIIARGGTQVIIASAVGHLFSLGPKVKGRYPIFDLEWKPVWEVSKSAEFAKPYAKLIEKLAKDADELIIAVDYDSEGEVIGLNCLRFLCKKEDAKRMKFSTLTAEDLRESYENILPSLAWGQAEAGEARHYLDWVWGINLSHAAMSALAEANVRKILSIGRVQGPALMLLAQRERDIQNFIAKPYWQITILLETKPKIEAQHHKNIFWDKKEAQKIFDKIKGKQAKVADIKTKEERVLPPTPFDLTSLQMEAWRNFKISPKATQQIAQELYTKALISYPRTSSQRLPPSLNYRKILNLLKKQSAYSKLAPKLLKQAILKPRQGARTDPAHPAIYPTGEAPRDLEPRQYKIYDLIVRRFLATFAPVAIKENTKAIFDIENEHFHYTGSRFVKQGWRTFYKYVEEPKQGIPAIIIGEVLSQDPKLRDKKTKPPKRYTPASIIKELAKRNLGTKATRAQVIDTLAKRGYITGTSIEVTKLGLELVNAFSKYAPDILSEQLTRHFEKQMDLVQERKKKKEQVFEEAKQILIRLLNQFNLHKAEIGKELATAVYESKKKEAFLMKCLKCKKGDIRITVSKKTGKSFAACSRYPECKTTYPLPQNAKITLSGELCKECSFPIIRVLRQRKRAFKMCLNQNCPSKAKWKRA